MAARATGPGAFRGSALSTTCSPGPRVKGARPGRSTVPRHPMRHGDPGGHAVRGQLPGQGRRAVRGLVSGVGPGDAAAGAGPEGEGAVARCGGGDAADGAVQPVGDGAEGVVVEGGHAAGVEGAVGTQAVPAFPDGGGSLDDRVEPGGALGLGEQPVRDVEVAGLGECVADERGADEAGGDAGVVAQDEGGEPVAYPGARRGRRAGRRRWRGSRPWGCRSSSGRRAGRTGRGTRRRLRPRVRRSAGRRRRCRVPARTRPGGGRSGRSGRWRRGGGRCGRAAGSSGGAAGSSQSPSWNPLSHSRVRPARRSTRSTQARPVG